MCRRSDSSMIYTRTKDLNESIEEILFDYLPRVYDELNKEEDYPYLQYFDVIHEKLTRAYYLSQYEKVMVNLKHSGWMNLTLQYYDGNPGALSFLMDLDKVPFRQGSSEEILAMITSFGLKGSQLWVFYKDCCNMDFETIEKIWLKWMNKEISAREILSHIQDGYGKIIRVELL